MKLYEFEFIRTWAGDDKSVEKQRLYQIVAGNEINAAVELGRIFHSDHYDIKVLSWKLIKTMK